MKAREALGWTLNLGEVLTIEELAAYLKIPKSTLYKLVRSGGIPSQKVGRHWRFRKAAIDLWLDQGKGEQQPGAEDA